MQGQDNDNDTKLRAAVRRVLDSIEGSDEYCDAMNEMAAAYDVCANETDEEVQR